MLKPIRNPIPMIARNNLRIRTPEFGVKYGYDLKLGQALPPFGNGEIADIEFTLSGRRIANADPELEAIDFEMEVVCPNEEDGFIEFIVEDTREFSRGSRLPSSHEAPADGYVPEIRRTAATGPGGKIGELIVHREKDNGKCYYFRVRTERDSKGKIVSAHYGKMYGPLEIRPALTRYGHDITKGNGGFYINYLYFNPTPSDRNVEFDPDKNIAPEQRVPIP